MPSLAIRAVGRSSVATGPGQPAGAARCRVRRSALPIPPSRLVSLWVALWDRSRSSASWCSSSSREPVAGRGSSPWKLYPCEWSTCKAATPITGGKVKSTYGRRIPPPGPNPNAQKTPRTANAGVFAFLALDPLLTIMQRIQDSTPSGKQPKPESNGIQPLRGNTRDPNPTEFNPFGGIPKTGIQKGSTLSGEYQGEGI